MFTLTNIDFSPLNEFVNHPDKHIQGFSTTFEETIKRGGPNSFVPMVTMFSNMEDIEITIQCRDYLDKDDMYKAFNEMLHYFSATEAHSFIFAMDIRQTSYSQKDPDSKKASATDALSLVFASEDSSGMLIMPYSIDDNDNVIWDTKEFNLTSLASDDPSKSYQGEIAELFYLMTHLDGPLFTAAQLLNYYNFKGYNFIFPDDAVAKSVIKVEI
jgi:hypothetical protein